MTRVFWGRRIMPVLGRQPPFFIVRCANAKQENGGLQIVLAQPGADLARHVLKIHDDLFLVPGVRRHDFPVRNGFRGRDFKLNRFRIGALRHQPDAPTGIAETLAQNADGNPFHIAAGMNAVIRQEPPDAFVYAA